MIPRTMYIGEQIEATMGFFDDNGLPISPSDPSLYPTYVLKDPNQELVVAGIGSFSAIDNLYHATFQIPDDAPISEDDAKYIIEWELISVGGKEYKSAEYSDVVHPSYNLTTTKEQQKIILPFLPLQLSLPIPSEPTAIEFHIYDESNNIIHTGTPESTGQYSGYYIYSINVASNILTTGQFYGGVWKFTIEGDERVYYQKIWAIDINAMSMISDLRMKADKVLKEIDVYTGYRDSDLYFHLQEGLNYLNMLWVPTSWTYVSFSGSLGLSKWSLYDCALWSLLRAQYLAEGDSAFSYDGQPVTLSVDRTSYIEAELGRLQDEIDDKIVPWKKQVIKRGRSVGHLGVTYPNVGDQIGNVRRQDYYNRNIPYRTIINRS